MTAPSIYDHITNNIITQLESGTVPWVKPWTSTGAGMPTNGLTMKPYSGVNILLCWIAEQDRGFTSSYWLTSNQARLAGTRIKKDEYKKATWLTMYKMITFKQERIDAKNEGREAKQTPMIKGFKVYNLDQCESVPEKLQAKPEQLTEATIHTRSEALILKQNAEIQHGGDRAYYSPTQDYIKLPVIESFPDSLDYYRTAFHELGHWTGHKTRLDRFNKSTDNGKTTYAREELVAELTAAYVSTTQGIEPTLNHASYIDSWLTCLKEDNKAIVQAASKASKAASYLLQ